MQSIKKYIILIIGFLFLMNNCAYSQNYSDRIYIIGNDFDTKSFTKSEIASIFKGKINNWNNGNRVTIVLILNEDEYSSHATKTIYNKTVNAVKKYWLGLVFQGRFEAPVFVNTNDEVLAVIKRNKGSIGILVDYNKNIDPKLTLNIDD